MKPPTGVLTFAKIICIFANEKPNKNGYFGTYKAKNINTSRLLLELDKNDLGGLADNQK